jgi:Ulp1 family protease
LLLQKEEWTFQYADVPQQEGNSNCGVFVLQHIKFALFNKEFPSHRQGDMDKVRYTMILELGEQAIRWEKKGLS